MSIAPDEIEQIVQSVLDRLGTPSVAVRSNGASVDLVSPANADSCSLHFAEPVITAKLLQERLGGAMRIEVGDRAVLTPSARDYLRNNKIDCLRLPACSKRQTGDLWLAVLSRHTPQLQSALDQLQGAGARWEKRLSGTPSEAARQGASAICRAEAAGVMVFTAEPELVACLANRNSKVRAAAIACAQTAAALRRSLGPNLLAINPAGKSMYELRNILKAVVEGGPPAAPSQWQSIEFN